MWWFRKLGFCCFLPAVPFMNEVSILPSTITTLCVQIAEDVGGIVLYCILKELIIALVVLIEINDIFIYIL